MERLAVALQRELGRLGPPTSLGSITERWPETVGAQIAANAWPARITRDGTLVVYARDSVWAFELTQQAKEIFRRLGDGPVTGMKFVPGPLPEPSAESLGETPREPPSAGPVELAAAAELSAGIADDRLRESVAKVAALSLARASTDRSFW